MNSQTFATCQQRRKKAQDANTVSTWHNGRFGVYQWDQLSDREKADHMAALQRNQHVQLFGIYS